MFPEDKVNLAKLMAVCLAHYIQNVCSFNDAPSCTHTLSTYSTPIEKLMCVRDVCEEIAKVCLAPHLDDGGDWYFSVIGRSGRHSLVTEKMMSKHQVQLSLQGY